MPQRDIYSKGIFSLETQKVTGGVLEFEQDPSTPVHSATPDGLFRLCVKKRLKQLPLPWRLCPTGQGEEVLLEIKMQKDHLDKEALSRAFLQRYAREVYRYENEKDFHGNTMLWLVAAHLPSWLSQTTEVVEISKGSGCYRVETKFFPFYWVASNELPLCEELIPFLVTRTGKSLEAFVWWVVGKRPPPWVILLLENVKMDKAFIEKMTNTLPEPIDAELQEQREIIWRILLKKNPKLKEKIVAQLVGQEVQKEVQSTLLRQLAKKLQKTLTSKETTSFFEKFEQEGRDAIEAKLVTDSKEELAAWLTLPAKKPTKKAAPKKTTKTKK